MSSIPLPEGFVLRDAFISEREHEHLVGFAAGLEYGRVEMHGVTARRRIVQYGWLYAFGSFQITPGPAIPDALLPLRDRAAELAGVEPERLEQALITDYPPGSRIGWHRDAPRFGVVVGVSLLSTCRFQLRLGEGRTARKVSLDLPPRSAYLLSGDARARWQHGIPSISERRISITFRSVRRR